MNNHADARLPDATKIGAVALTVRDLARSIAYYSERIGLRVLEQGSRRTLLGVKDRVLVELLLLPEAKPSAQGTTGLYHFALLLPTRAPLGLALQHLLSTQTPISGASDHAVSEALYLTDPDGHGIEIYCDRPRNEWPMAGDGQVAMTVDPLDHSGLLATVEGQEWVGLPMDTVMGHMHLSVSDLAASETFYTDMFGFNLMQRFRDQASFLAAGGYHHHLGINIWSGRGAPPPPNDTAALQCFEIILPDSRSLETTLARLEDGGAQTIRQEMGWLVRDPDRIGIILRKDDMAVSSNVTNI